MKTLFISAALLLASFNSSLNAQSFNKEFGIRLSDEDNLDFTFHKKISDNTYRKIRLSNFSINSIVDDLPGSQFSFAGDISYSKEKRTVLGSDFTFYRGWEYGLNLALSASNGNDWAGITPYIGYTVGAMYPITKRLLVSIDILPRMKVRSTINDGDFSGFQFSTIGFDTDNIGLSARYAFGEEK